MMSTLLGFGLLALSHTYAIHCFGLTVLFGVFFRLSMPRFLRRQTQNQLISQRTEH